MKLFERIADSSLPPLIIAEIGINHGGNLEVAKRMAEAAVNAGCECIKHQTHFVDDEMTEEAKYIYPPNDPRSIWDVISDNSLSPAEEEEFKDFVEGLGCMWISTPFSRRAVDFLSGLGVECFKVGSGECNNLPLVRYIASKGRPVIMSTGMNSVGAVKASVDMLIQRNIPLVLLECTNLYPSPPEYVSLLGMDELKAAFPKIPIGFSDHSIGPYIALAAVARGARVIERHFVDSRYRVGPDVACSMDDLELRQLIKVAGEIHQALMNPKARTEKEEAVYAFARGSIVADRDISAGEVLSEHDIWARRPGTGEIAAADYDLVVGKVLKRDVLKNYQIKWSDLEK